jgi:cytochrome c oxidase cbb3-type subunit 4
MNASIWGHLSGVVTLVLMLVFLGIWFWAWRPWHRRTFDRLARMPLEDRDGRGPSEIPAEGEARR